MAELINDSLVLHAHMTDVVFIKVCVGLHLVLRLILIRLSNCQKGSRMRAHAGLAILMSLAVLPRIVPHSTCRSLLTSSNAMNATSNDPRVISLYSKLL